MRVNDMLDDEIIGKIENAQIVCDFSNSPLACLIRRNRDQSKCES